MCSAPGIPVGGCGCGIQLPDERYWRWRWVNGCALHAVLCVGDGELWGERWRWYVASPSTGGGEEWIKERGW
jgi:hypothetical protein